MSSSNSRPMLADGAQERASCGVGFIADLNQAPTHRTLLDGLAALKNVSHRGAVSADGKTADGAGILTHLPKKLLRHALRSAGIDYAGQMAAGMFMCWPKGAGLVKEIAAQELARVGMNLLLWREVPVDHNALGESAKQSCPEFRMAIIAVPQEAESAETERRLYVARRRTAKRLAAVERACAPMEGTHIASLSAHHIVYKGLVTTHMLPAFFQDLTNERFETRLVVFHQRFSTNTRPSWAKAQPLRMMAHNGEINTVRGNLSWLEARQDSMISGALGHELHDVLPIVNPDDSDSASFDKMLELLVRAGRKPERAVSMMVPEPHQHAPDMDHDTRAMFEYNSALLEPWGGPGAFVFADGNTVGAALDRNGLRPMRYWVRDDNVLVVASEAGVVPCDDQRIIEKGRLGPGHVITANFDSSSIQRNDEVKTTLAKEKPYANWVNNNLLCHEREGLQRTYTVDNHLAANQEERTRLQKAFGYGRETMERIIGPMAELGTPPVGSMGDDTPLAVFSAKPQLTYRYFKQRFAQVTNPPIDPIREELVMSLQTAIGRRGNLLADEPDAAALIRFPSPVLTDQDMHWCLEKARTRSRTHELDTTFAIAEGPGAMEKALETIAARAAEAVAGDAEVLVLTDKNVSPDRAAIPALLVTAAVHQRLVDRGLRLRASIIIESAEVREDHHFACLLGYGATMIHPYLALASAASTTADPTGHEGQEAARNYVAAVEAGLRKIMSKMGIATLHSYRGAQQFEALGLAEQVVRKYFTRTTASLAGVTMEQIAADTLAMHAEAWADEIALKEEGIYRFRRGGEYHALNPMVFKQLHKAVRTQDEEAYAKYAELVDSQPACNIRDLLAFKPKNDPISIDEVEPVEAIARRFCTQAMSHGALSREAHEVLSVAMNRIGGKSNSGEGGESFDRTKPYDGIRLPQLPGGWQSKWAPGKDDLGNSAIKQIAAGRFGVTARYLVSASELEIKMAQGAKPGEGGQVPGMKVTEEIAQLRGATTGTSLISPPPHHDIYSIEDLEQLIYDLKRVNKTASVTVKLVSCSGVGTIAAGVAKAYAENIQISGCDGGTGASPLSSLKHAGMPWELGLAETQQVLVRDKLRERVLLRVDGGLRTGRDVVIAAMLGAEEYGFGTTALIAAGCVMARQCHSNTCPVGIAAQKPELRKKFPGTPDHVIAFMMFVAEHTRAVLASLGLKSIDEAIGRVDILEQNPEKQLPNDKHVDLSALLADPAEQKDGPRLTVKRTKASNPRPEPTTPMDEQVYQACKATAELGEPSRVQFDVRNGDRSVGARLAGEIARKHPESPLAPGTAHITLNGVVGQSLGAWSVQGMQIELIGEAQDYVAKGMSGGRITLRPSTSTPIDPAQSTIMGNTCLYGATGGEVFASGRAGERFCVRNSGATTVVEGTGDHACEYMTGGTVVILGPTGKNFGAGMTGGVAYVYDHTPGYLERHYNPHNIDLRRAEQHDSNRLKALVEQHAEVTQSPRAAELLADWDNQLRNFWVAEPIGTSVIAPAADAQGELKPGPESEYSAPGSLVTDLEQAEANSEDKE